MLGCRLNEAELEQWSQRFQDKGFAISTSPRDADLIVFNTCAVTHEASRKSRQLISRLHRDNPEAKLIVTGCHASLDTDAVAQTLGVDLVVSNADKHDLPAIAQRALALPTMPRAAEQPGATALYARGRHRAFIKIQDGCRYRCTFCIVTVARGEERSRPIREIVDEVRAVHAQGIQEIVLTGVHVGGYGGDLGTNLFTLVQALLADTDIPRIRFASVEPWDLPDRFFSLFENARLMPHMHLPLQSGSDSVLRRMARRCRTSDFRALVERARAQVDRFNVTTDIIVGFPGESAAEWSETLAFLPEIGFGHLHIFPYSPRAGTKAASLPGQVDTATKQARCHELAALGQAMKRRALQGMMDRTVEVLWEQPSVEPDISGQTVRYAGYTPEYHRVQAKVGAEIDLEYRITKTRITGIDPATLTLIGDPIEPSARCS